MTATRKLVLIADDEPDICRLLRYHLHKLGHRTLTAADGRTALSHVFEHNPDLLILDLMMPHLHGYEVCRLSKAGPVTRHIPVLMLTALSNTESKLRGFKLGANDYVTKPFEIRELMARVQVLLSLSTLAPAVPDGLPSHDEA